MHEQRRIHFFYSTIYLLIVCSLTLLFADSCSHDKAPESYKGPGLILTPGMPENKMFLSIVYPELFPASEIGWEEDNREENEYEPRKVSVDDIMKRIDTYKNLDGYQLPGGRIFNKNSTILMMLYNEAIYAHDQVGDCATVSNIMKDYETLYHAKDLILDDTWSPQWFSNQDPENHLILIFPDDDGYTEIRNEKTRRIAFMNIMENKNCADIAPFIEKLGKSDID